MNSPATFTHNQVKVTYQLFLPNGRNEMYGAQLIFNGKVSDWLLIKTVKGSYKLKNRVTGALTKAMTRAEVFQAMKDLIPAPAPKLNKKQQFKAAVARNFTEIEMSSMGFSAGCSNRMNHSFAENPIYQAAFAVGYQLYLSEMEKYTQDAMGAPEGMFAFI